VTEKWMRDFMLEFFEEISAVRGEIDIDEAIAILARHYESRAPESIQPGATPPTSGRCKLCAGQSVPEPSAAPMEEARQALHDHLAHVQKFLQEMYATMVDPCDDFQGNIAELCELLIKTAREQREQAAHSTPPQHLT
jgi:hypothetical protein